jgi:hypothetical protein
MAREGFSFDYGYTEHKSNREREAQFSGVFSSVFKGRNGWNLDAFCIVLANINRTQKQSGRAIKHHKGR